MDFISSSQLHSYQSIIDKIQREHEKSEKLKQEIDKENNKIIISHLSRSHFSQKISHINVKIFSDLVDLFHLYRDEINSGITSFFKHESCKYYLVEVLLTNALHKKLIDIDWSLVIFVKYENVCLSKTLQVKNSTMPIFEVLAVDERVVDCKVFAYLILPTDDGCFNITLGSVDIDISYHFEINKKSTSVSRTRKILELAKNYNLNFDFLEVRKPLMLEYEFLTYINSKEFVKKFIQNCYHKIDLEYFSELGTDSKNHFVLKFSTGLDKHSITYDRDSNLLTLKGSFDSLFHLKNYFCQGNCIEVINNVGQVQKDIKDLLSSLNKCEEKDDLLSVYVELRRFWIKSYQ